MSRKLVLVMSLTIVLIGMLGVALKVQRIEAGGTITIKADGSINPPDAPINTTDMVTYYFTDNINEPIMVMRDNIVVDGADYTLLGPGFSGTGIYLWRTSNVTIKNTRIRLFYDGVSLYESSNNTISKNNITNNVYGIRFSYSSNNTISGNSITNNGDGIRLTYSSNNNIFGNNMTANHNIGIVLDPSSNNNTIIGNNITSNPRGIFLYQSSNNTFYYNNIANDFQIYVENSTNVWDDGAGKGNYWSDYEDKYPDAEEIDGIWDTPYKIDDYNQDNYPIVPEFPTWTSMLLLLLMLTVAIVIYKRRLVKTSIH